MSINDAVKAEASTIAEKAIFYGVPGVGKTTAACSYPDPIVIASEVGLDALPNIRRHVIDSWEEIVNLTDDAISQADRGKLKCKTIIYETLDSMERLCWDYTCRHNYTDKIWKSIEAAGYQKGYTEATRTWMTFRIKLNRLHTLGVHIVLTAHSQIKKMKNPDGSDYDRYRLKLHDGASDLFTEWASEVFFCRHEMYVTVDKDKVSNKEKAIGQTGDERYAYTTWDATYEAKHRRALPKQLLLPDPRTGASFYETMLAARAGEVEKKPTTR